MKFQVSTTTLQATASVLPPKGWNPPPPGADRVKKLKLRKDTLYLSELSEISLLFIISGSLLMVATGYFYEKKAQVVDIQSNTKCTDLADYPMYLGGATGGLIDKRPLICGGHGSTGSNSTCYIFKKETNQWQLHANLITERYRAASALLPNGSLFITGGSKSRFGSFASTEIISADGSVNVGWDLPEPTAHHCMVSMDDGRVAIMGGEYPQKKKVYLYDPQTPDQFKDGPSMLFDRFEAGCTLFYSTKHGGRPVILVAGGYDQTTSEIWDYTAVNNWEQSKHIVLSLRQITEKLKK